MESTFFVICRDDNNSDGTPGEYLLATRKTFATRGLADSYAAGVAQGRVPIVVEAPKGMTYPVEPATRPMQAFFFSPHGFVAVINSDDPKAETRANEIAVRQFNEVGITETPKLIGVATLPRDGVIVAWGRHDPTPDTPKKPNPYIEAPGRDSRPGEIERATWETLAEARAYASGVEVLTDTVLDQGGDSIRTSEPTQTPDGRFMVVVSAAIDDSCEMCGHSFDDHTEGEVTGGACWHGAGDGNRCPCGSFTE